ncbi:MAG TPA: PEPxxWA-CTERM sorting domain-containing protein [Phenylobacterium sp.]
MKRLLLAAALSAIPAAALADPVNQVDYFSLTATQLLDFNSDPAAPLPGTSYNTIINPHGVGIAERFFGQTIMDLAGADKLGDHVTGPLTLVAGAPNQNVGITQYGSSHVVLGLGPVGYPSFDALGEGALSFLFSGDQSQFGFAVYGANQGDVTLDFWRANGSLIQSVVINGVGDTYYGFQREGGVNDIRGVSIWNNDAAGIAFNKIKYDTASNLTDGGGGGGGGVVAGGAPEPGTWALMLGGFGLAGAALRRRRIAGLGA